MLVYRKGLVEVEAVQFLDSPQNTIDVIAWAAEHGVKITVEHDGYENGCLLILSKFGVLRVSVGDWVIRDGEGRFFCVPLKFLKRCMSRWSER